MKNTKNVKLIKILRQPYSSMVFHHKFKVLVERQKVSNKANHSVNYLVVEAKKFNKS